MNFNGLIIGVGVFVIIGVLHPIVIKVEYYFGKQVWPLFLFAGIACNILSILSHNQVLSVLAAVWGFSLFWSIGELFHQEERVRKGWFPKNPSKMK